jgi:hypothetical protein
LAGGAQKGDGGDGGQGENRTAHREGSHGNGEKFGRFAHQDGGKIGSGKE